MPIIILFVGVMLVAAGINGKVTDLMTLVKEDFSPSSGQPGFQVWILVIFLIGAIGYIKGFKPVANAFFVLLIVVMFLSNKGFFDKFTQALSGKTSSLASLGGVDFFTKPTPKQ